ncbi:MAG: GxxExxY protein [Rhodocyclales bacterium]|nr:GxxExxY protein [Rhodocyclales bacterium]
MVELKTVDKLQPIHDAQLLTYLRILGKPDGLLLNFRQAPLKTGLKRIVNNFTAFSAPRRLGGSTGD